MYRILIVEDEKWIRLGIQAMIDCRENAITETLTAQDAKQGLELWRAFGFEIVISDVKMPGMDGCAMCEQIYCENPQTAFIIISGHNDFEYARRALGFRAADYLLKPVNKQSLNNAIAQCVTHIAKQRGDEKVVDNLRLLNVNEREADIAEKAIKYIEANYDKKINLSDLAEELFINETYLSPLLKRALGVPPIQYITNLRVTRATELLANTNQKISNIAVMTGYPDQTYFTKVFKRVTGKSPTEYRQENEG